MHRHLIGALAAAAMLPFAALDAAAAPGMATQFGKTYKLYCAANGTGRIYVGNRTAPAIKAGTNLQITLWTYQNGPIVKTVTAPRTYKSATIVKTLTAPHTLIGIYGVNFEFPQAIRMCEASVTLQPKIGKIMKPAG